jgi:VanZ family protein
MSRNLNKYSIPVIVWAILIMIVSSIPYLGPSPINFTYSDKVEHCCEYAVLGFLLAYAFAKSRPGPVFLVVLMICAAYGIFDELHQLFVPGRNCDPMDAAADILGSAAGAGIYMWLKGRYACLSFRNARSSNT